MNLQDIENKLIDYLDDALTADQRKEVEQELKNSADLRQALEELKMVMSGLENSFEYQPSTRLQKNFDDFLENLSADQVEEKLKISDNDTKVIHLQDRSSNRHRIFMQFAAAAAILLFGIFVGSNLGGNKDKDIENGIAELRKEMLDLLDKENSTSGRIRAVNISYKLPEEHADDEIVQALIQTMNIDGSTNVRLAAMEALFEFADEPKVRTALCETLSIQKNPSIQLSLIKMLVHLKEKQAVKYFEDLVKKDDTNPEVKDEAQMGIFKMM